MANNFVPGTGFLANGQLSTNPVVWQTGPGGANAVLLAVLDHNLEEMVALFDVSNTSHGGKTARLAGKQDYQGTVNASLDLDAAPWAVGINIRAGQNGLFGAVYTGSLASIWSVPMIVERVHYQMRIDAEIKYSFDVKMNVLALKTFSTISLPVKPDGLAA